MKRNPPVNMDVDTELSPEDVEFIDSIQQEIEQFVQSGSTVLELNPMNSYKRRLVHKVAGGFGLQSKSTGSPEERYVCLLKTEKTTMPPKRNTRNDRDRNDSNQVFNLEKTFFAVPETTIVLRSDGSVGMELKDERQAILDRRIITDGEFKVINNKIICPTDEAWE